jgi:hypothetical protein
LIVVVPDSHADATLKSLLSQNIRLQIRPIEYQVQLFARRDPGCLRDSHEFLRPFIKQFDHAIVMFDREGSGQDDKTREELEAIVQGNLDRSGWHDRSSVIVFDPELEIWVWSDSPEVDAVLGWSGRSPALRDWMKQQNFLVQGEQKPMRPKEAMLAALKEVRRAPSASVFHDLARRVSLNRCIDPAFVKFRKVLSEWFPPTS